MEGIKITFSNKKSSKQMKEKGVSPVVITEGEETEVVKVSGQKQMVISVEKKKEMTLRKLHVLARKVVTLAKANKIKKLAITADDFKFDSVELDDFELGKLLAMNFAIANYEFNRLKTKPKEGWDHVTQIAVAGSVSKELKDGFAYGKILGEGVNHSRELANTPGGEMTPALMAQAAKDLSKGTDVKVNVLGKPEIEKLKMGGVLGVAQGSDEDPKFIVMEYMAGEEKERPMVLVGKGVTFDTGGVLVKPFEGITDMHMDMSGGGSVIATIVTAARLGIKKNIVAIVPAVENMISGNAFRPHDVLRSMSGKTIEVLHTDAEGRLILADGLYYAGKEYKPRLVVDVATLTGAALVALGHRASALFTRDFDLSKNMMDWAEKIGDHVWPLPLWEEYEAEVKGNTADVMNLGKHVRAGGSITAAAFLLQFTKDYPKDCVWAHIDIAPRMVAIEGDEMARGAAGAPVRLLIEMLENY